MEKISKYLRDTATEMKHVKWPTSTQAAVYTVLVIAVSALVAVVLAGFDYVFTSLLETVI